MLTLVLSVVFIALVFEYINGFHDTANSIATSVATKVLTPGQAIVLATVFNLLGALAGTAVAKTIGSGLVDTNMVTLTTILAALIGGIAWNLLTWWLGLPSSSSHALIGGLVGAAYATAHHNMAVIKWSDGLWPKVVKPMMLAPILGLLIGFFIMMMLMVLLRGVKPRIVNTTFGKLQLLSAAWMSWGHGKNDAQKTMGIIALALFTATNGKVFDHLPKWLSFLHTPTFEVALWVKVSCALVMGAGTAAGGWRIIHTMGRNVVKMQPIHGFAAQTTAAAIIETASHWGIPLSTTHVISSSIMGVGATKRLNAVKWSVAERILWAWILTLPATSISSYLLMRLFMMF